jgi:hypothetical protein
MTLGKPAAEDAVTNWRSAVTATRVAKSFDPARRELNAMTLSFARKSYSRARLRDGSATTIGDLLPLSPCF